MTRWCTLSWRAGIVGEYVQPEKLGICQAMLAGPKNFDTNQSVFVQKQFLCFETDILPSRIGDLGSFLKDYFTST